MAKEVKLLAACGAGVNSSHQIKDAVEEEMKKRRNVDTMFMLML